MAQHDYNIANQSGSGFRSDLNNALSAILSNNSGSSQPSTRTAHMLWADTSNNLLKLRNAANSAWITLRTLAGNIDTTPLGIGTDSPSSYSSEANTLVVYDSGKDSGITIATNSSSYNSNIYFADGTGSNDENVGRINFDHSTNEMNFWVNGYKRVRLGQNGTLVNMALNNTFLAQSSATAAAASAASAATAYDNFDDRYLGSKTSDPTLDNDGNALITGALYFNSTEGEMRIYDGSVWIAASSASVETMEKFNFTATSGQTVFTGSDDNAKVLALTVGAEIVTLNGVVLEETTDYTRTSDTITLTSGATTGDEVNVFAFGNFTVADTVSASSGGTFTGAVTMNGGATVSGNLSVDGGTIKLDGNYPVGTENVALGNEALDALTSGGDYNTALGYAALTANTSGQRNTAVGRTAMSAHTTGSFNTAVGMGSLSNSTSANYNTGLGYNALANNTTASNNTAVGYAALEVNTTGAANVAVGYQSLDANTTGGTNTAIGYNSLSANTTAGNSVAVGYQALFSNTTAVDNTAVGSQALQDNTTGGDNTAIGRLTLFENTTGARNTALGHAALRNNTTANDNTAIGTSALSANTTGAANTVVGRGALDTNTTGNSNNAFGYNSLTNTTTGTLNSAFGNEAGLTNATGGQNAYFGSYSGYAATGTGNTFLGYGAGFSVTTGQKNTIIGAYQGNQNGLDIRTSSNNIVLSDGNGNPRLYFDSSARSVGGWISDDAITGMTTGGSGVGLAFGLDGFHEFQRNAGPIARIGRIGDDGNLIEFFQSAVQEGSISVSGSTVSYNGGHLSRWSRLADDSKDTSIVKGTVMTNLDAMVEWGDEDNEQLNKMAVSSVEGDANVAGVFVNWDEDDDWNDMNIAMTGDMVIRIAQGTTVARGDLLMSAGDGTAKPQGDDIVRSKTIAKVTSTHVSHTYDDGSYLVPCVLMAC